MKRKLTLPLETENCDTQTTADVKEIYVIDVAWNINLELINRGRKNTANKVKARPAVDMNRSKSSIELTLRGGERVKSLSSIEWRAGEAEQLSCH